MAASYCTQWPYFIWKLKNFHKLTRVVKANCSVENVHFNLILEQRRFEVPENDCFKMYIEGIPQQNRKNIEKTVPMIARTYILGKLEEKLSPSCKNVEISDRMKYFDIWELNRNVLLKLYDCYRQTNGEVFIVTYFQPVTHLEISCPQIVLPKEDTYPNKDIFLWNSLDGLSRDFEAFFENSEGNVFLKAGNYNSLVHKTIIDTRCAEFGRMVSRLLARSFHLEVPQFDAKTLEIFLRYIYSGRIRDVSAKDAQKLFTFGSKYAITHLADLCAKIMVHHATEENVFEFLLLAQEHEHENFKSGIIDYILRKNILKSKSWLTFSASNMKLALEVYQANVAKSPTFQMSFLC